MELYIQKAVGIWLLGVCKIPTDVKNQVHI